MEAQANQFESEFTITGVSPAGYDGAGFAAYVPASARAVLDCGLGDGTRAAAIKARTKARLTVAPLALETPVPGHPADSVLDAAFGSDDFAPGEAAYDCIVCDNALPKVRDAEPVMARLALALRPGGLAVFAVPNLQHWQCLEMLARGQWNLTESGALARDHLRFFTALELVNLTKRAGLTVQRCAALESDPPEAMPLDADRCYQNGDLTLGPLEPNDHQLFRARTLLLLATR